MTATASPSATPSRALSKTPTPNPTPARHNPGVTDLLQHPPAAGESVELDAYFSGAAGFPFSGGGRPPQDKVVCPNPYFALSDQPYLPYLNVLNLTHGNPVPEDTPRLIATDERQKQPGVITAPGLPYHARLRGHFGEPAFAQCENADRIFLVEAVVRVYEAHPSGINRRIEPPADYAAWPRYHDEKLGFSLPYPPDWKVGSLSEPKTLGGVLVRSPQWSQYPVTVRVYTTDSKLDPGLQPNTGGGSFQQSSSWSQNGGPIQGLRGEFFNREPSDSQYFVAVLFRSANLNYEVALTYPLGFDASQTLLNDYTGMVEGFRLDAGPGPAPTRKPRVKSTAHP